MVSVHITVEHVRSRYMERMLFLYHRLKNFS